MHLVWAVRKHIQLVKYTKNHTKNHTFSRKQTHYTQSGVAAGFKQNTKMSTIFLMHFKMILLSQMGPLDST